MKQEIEPVETGFGAAEDRRDFLKSCGKFAVTVPPVVTVLLSTSLASEALAKSTGDTGIKRNQDTGIKRNQDTGVKYGN
jgi:hypothetical protein